MNLDTIFVFVEFDISSVDAITVTLTNYGKVVSMLLVIGQILQ